jgi:hypothetical protein
MKLIALLGAGFVGALTCGLGVVIILLREPMGWGDRGGALGVGLFLGGAAAWAVCGRAHKRLADRMRGGRPRTS